MTETTKQVISENLTKSPAEKLHEGLRHIPENMILQCLQTVHHQYLPKVIASRGADHADTKFFTEIRDSLIWCLNILERYNTQSIDIYNVKLLTEFYQNRCRQLETQLSKYQALEDIELQGTLEDYRATIINKAKTILDGNNQPKQ